MIDRKDIALGIMKNKAIVNHTDSPDEMISLCAFIVSLTVDTIEKYSLTSHVEELSRQDIKNKILSGVQVYELIDSGMTPEEAMEVIGIKGEAFEVPKENTD